ncbi:hypothetical protein I4F81_010585 [Pyropia yezoensis]|uniref:Uncharacterized protein n=1 Tax=Pyropia yezoensis TaxID=2788 RepID=A0ACC3CDD9_PYRYE|nr:hypothetical protein I4F81_010585 [Neopyropia yezoensis]
MQRLEQYSRSVGRLLRAAGVADESPPADDVDGVTSDVDVEALMRSTLDATREFDAFLVSLVHEAPPDAIALRQEIDRLEQDLKDKAQLVEQTRALLRDHQTQLLYAALLSWSVRGGDGWVGGCASWVLLGSTGRSY